MSSFATCFKQPPPLRCCASSLSHHPSSRWSGFRSKSLYSVDLGKRPSSSSTSSSSSSSSSTYTYHEPLDTSNWKTTGSSSGRLTPTSIVLACIPIITFGLGTWQVKRLFWKRNLIADLDEKMARDAIELPRNVNAATVPEFAYRKVILRGHFDSDRNLFVGPRTREGDLGYYVITPFIRSDGGSPILVNRGFIRKDKKDGFVKSTSSQAQGEMELEGMLRAPQTPTLFSPKNCPSKEQWLFVDVTEISEVLNTDPILIDAITYANGGVIGKMLSDGDPVGRGGSIQLRNMHASYIATWYGLSLITSILAWRLLRKPVSDTSRFAGIK